MVGMGTPLDMVVGIANIEDIKSKPGLWLVVLRKGVIPDQIEHLRGFLEENRVLALLVMESALKEIRFLDKHDLRTIKASVGEALGEVTAAQSAVAPAELTPERVVAALSKRPDLLDGVRRLLLNNG